MSGVFPDTNPNATGGQTLWGAEGLWGLHRESIGRTRIVSWLDSGTKWMPGPGSVFAVLGLCVYPQFGMHSGSGSIPDGSGCIPAYTYFRTMAMDVRY